MPIKGNKGEWSEFYVFIKLLDERKLYTADENLIIDKSFFYPILNICRDEDSYGRKTYDLMSKDKNIKIIDRQGDRLVVIDGKNLKQKVEQIFEEISSASGQASFSIDCADELIDDLLCDSIKMPSNNKHDILVSIQDVLGIQPEYGYSIKSMIGAASTLLNSSGATNFIYEVKGLDENLYLEVDAVNTFKDKLDIIYSNGGSIDFKKMSSDIFKSNLQMIDIAFPQIMAEFLLKYYKGEGNTFDVLLDKINQDKIIQGLSVSKKHLRYKIKNFLINIALGMVPATEWDSYLKAYGGYIIVRKDGSICCYQLNKRDVFQDYLYNNIKFDTPSTTKFKFGKIYKEGDGTFIKLNLQIRFKK
jgi:HpaII restriction endonuclease